MTSDDLRSISAGLLALSTVALLGAVDPVSIAAALPAIALVTALAAYSPVGISAAVIVALPFFYRAIGVGDQMFAPSEILLAALALGSAARLALDLVRDPHPGTSLMSILRRTIGSRVIQVALALAVVGAVAVATGYDPDARPASLREWRWSMLEPLILVSILAVFATRGHARAILTGSLLLAGAVAAAHGIVQLASDGGIAADSVRRVSGPLPHPNALALFLVKPLVLGAVLVAWSPRWRLVCIPPVLLIGVALLATFSRGAMIAVTVAAVFVAFHMSRRVVFAVGAGAVAIAVGLVLIARDRMLSAFEGGSVSLRLDIWSSALAMIRDRPVLGYGPDQFLYAYAPRYIQPTAWDERFTSHAHNLILDSWIRLGLIGAILAVLVIAVVAGRLGRTDLHGDRHDIARSAALVALGAAIVHGLIDDAYFAHDLAMSSWLLAWLGFSTAAGNDGKSG